MWPMKYVHSYWKILMDWYGPLPPDDWHFVKETTVQGWIPLTKGQSCGKRAHVMALTMRRVGDRKRTDDCIMSHLTDWFRVKYTISFEICALFCCRFLKDSCCPFSYFHLGCYTNIVAIVWLPNAREVTLKSMCKLNLPVSNHNKT